MNGREAFEKARRFLIENRTRYDIAYQGFSWPELEDFNWALDWFEPFASGNSSLALLSCDENGTESRLSFQELSRRSNQVANFLGGMGLERGDRILLMLPNVVSLWEVMLAAIKAGLVVVPTTTLLSPADLQDRIRRGRVRCVITESEQTEKFTWIPGGFERIAVGCPVAGWTDLGNAHGEKDVFVPKGRTLPGDPLFLYFTSGTTSRPKLVLQTHQSYPVGHLSTMYWIGLLPGDIHLNVSSPGWAKHAWSSFFAPWNAGAALVAYRYERFNPRGLLDVLVRHNITTFCAPPTVWRLLIREKLDEYPVKIREIVSAGEPLSPNVIETVKKAWGILPRDGFGQTETTAAIGNSPGQLVKPGSVGRPLPGYRVSLLDVEGTEAVEGQIALGLDPPPVGLMRGYLVDDRVAPLDLLVHRWYLTGDIASRDEEGYYTYVGRSDDVFKSSDYRISPFELESVIGEHAAVAEAAVVPSPHPTKLSVPKAFISLVPGVEPSRALAREIFSFLRHSLSPFKRIRRIEFVDLPKTASGKIRRVELRHREEQKTRRGPLEFWEEDFPELRQACRRSSSGDGSGGYPSAGNEGAQ